MDEKLMAILTSEDLSEEFILDSNEAHLKPKNCIQNNQDIESNTIIDPFSLSDNQISFQKSLENSDDFFISSESSSIKHEMALEESEEMFTIDLDDISEASYACNKRTLSYSKSNPNITFQSILDTSIQAPDPALLMENRLLGYLSNSIKDVIIQFQNELKTRMQDSMSYDNIISSFISNLSSDIRTILNSSENATKKESFSEAKSNVEELFSLLNKVFPDFNKISQSQPNINELYPEINAYFLEYEGMASSMLYDIRSHTLEATSSLFNEANILDPKPSKYLLKIRKRELNELELTLHYLNVEIENISRMRQITLNSLNAFRTKFENENVVESEEDSVMSEIESLIFTLSIDPPRNSNMLDSADILSLTEARETMESTNIRIRDIAYKLSEKQPDSRFIPLPTPNATPPRITNSDVKRLQRKVRKVIQQAESNSSRI